MKRGIIVLVMLFAISGCDLIETGNKAKEGADVVADAIDKSEPVIASIEDITGASIAPTVVDRGEKIAATTEKVAKVGAGVAGMIPGGSAAAPFLLAIASVAGAMAEFFRRRKATTEKAAIVMSKALDKVGSGGKTVASLALGAGVADEVERIYRKFVA